QWKHNVVGVSAKKNGGFRQGVSESTVNPNESHLWLMDGLSLPSVIQVLYVVFSFLVGSLVVSLCGSGSFMQAAMETGRSCVMFEINGLLKVFSLLSEKQYTGAKQRMTEVYRVVAQQKDLTTYW